MLKSPHTSGLHPQVITNQYMKTTSNNQSIKESNYISGIYIYI